MLKTAESILVTIGVMSLMLFAFYGLSHVIVTHAPSPVSSWISSYVQRTTASGWSNT